MQARRPADEFPACGDYQCQATLTDLRDIVEDKTSEISKSGHVDPWSRLLFLLLVAIIAFLCPTNSVRLPYKYINGEDLLIAVI